ncbi:MAG TPA: DoxX family protein [Propionibacteriaceae bacterium]|nr:DoxX family protein [Propionibacteriaceae bacterium]HML50910.1 DoxX family protein [Propionicimonas sp.]
MSLFRFAARSLLASYFVVNGVNALRKPEDFTDAAKPVLDMAVPACRRVLPSEVASFLPDDATGVVRLTAAAQIVGGFCLATGLARRFGAALLAASMVPTVVSRNPLTGDAQARSEFGTDIALLGGVALASMDTEGEPDMFWRLRMRRRMLSSDAARRKAERATKRALRSGESTAS